MDDRTSQADGCMMERLRALTAERWPLAAAALSLAMLAVAHAFERLLDLPPCELCLRQREIYWAVLAMSVTGLVLWRVKPTPRFLTALNVLVGLVFVTGAVVAFYHVGVEYGWFPAPPGCAATLTPAEAARLALEPGGSLDRARERVSCTDAPWHFLGLSMAAWNGVASLAFAAASFLAAARTSDGRAAG